MKTESLNALLMDRELGELQPEALELLEAWLAEHPGDAASVPSIRRTLSTATAAVHRYPELAKPEIPVRISRTYGFELPRWRLVPLAVAASVLILVAGTSWLAYLAGQSSAQNNVAVQRPKLSNQTQLASKQPDPWTHYALAPDRHGGLTIIRRDTKPQS